MPARIRRILIASLVAATAATCCVSGLAIQAPPPGRAEAAHPLDPLSREELAAVSRLLRASGRVSASTRYPLIALREPPKEEVLSLRPGAAVRREAEVVAYDRDRNRTFEGVVDLRAGRVIEWNECPGVQPSFTLDDFRVADQVVRADPRWQEALRRRGITDSENVSVDSWPYGGPAPDGSRSRMVRAVSHYGGGGSNPLSRPVEGIVAEVDLNARKVVRFHDTGIVPIAPAAAEYRRTLVGPLRPALSPLHIGQPAGPGFAVRGSEVRWDRWRFRFSLHPREGLVLHQVGWQDGTRIRSILYRASLAEMAVPYADPSSNWSFRAVFDAGENGLGWMAMPLEPGRDAPENAVFFPAVLANHSGEPYESPRVVALYERDGGLLWKHYDLGSQENESRRGRQLVLGIVSTVGNYDYGTHWIFHQDGTLEAELELTGIMTAKGVPRRSGSEENHSRPAFGHLVAPHVEAVHHQHFFSFRLDLDVDGADGNTVVEQNALPLPAGPDNPLGNGFVMRETPLAKEGEAKRRLDLASSRRWKVIHPAVRNALGQAVGYTLLPGENALPLSLPGSPFRRRAGFLEAHLWATPYARDEQYPAGRHPNQSAGGDDGLAAWTRADRPLVERDVVLWYTLGVTHLPRPEDFPVMPVHRAGFRLVPTGFFARNPALDVP